MQNKLLDHLEQVQANGAILHQALAEFAAPKAHTLENFKAGVKRFVAFANMPPDEREHCYGSRFAGLYINNHLAQLWNTNCPMDQKVEPHSLDSFTVGEWEYIFKDNCLTLHYPGERPADALNQLLSGPAVIDCGMFCQLGIWFGILNILGDDAFNAQFGQQPFLLTRFIYEEMKEGREHLGNPLFAYFSEEELAGVGIEHLFNDQNYAVKHPGGNAQGENALIIDNVYYIFDPLRPANDLTREGVIAYLLEAFNAEPDSNDADALSTFRENSDFFEDRYGSIYAFPGSAIAWAQCLISDLASLKFYARTMSHIPECQAKMQEMFPTPSADSRVNFIIAFLEDDIGEKQEKFEAFYENQCVKDAFQGVLKLNKALFKKYYHVVLELFLEYHHSMAEHTVSQEDYVDSHLGLSDIPSHLHFDLDQFLMVRQVQLTRMPAMSSMTWQSDLGQIGHSETSCSLTVENDVATQAPRQISVRSMTLGCSGDYDPNAVIHLPRKKVRIALPSQTSSSFFAGNDTVVPEAPVQRRARGMTLGFSEEY